MCGPLDNVQKSIIIIGDNEYTIQGSDSVLKAVDKLFKVGTILNLRFPKASKDTWQYLTKYVYGLPVQNKFGSISNLHATLENHKLLLKSKQYKKEQKEEKKTVQKQDQTKQEKPKRKKEKNASQIKSKKMRSTALNSVESN